jgi:hypothetical protein
MEIEEVRRIVEVGRLWPRQAISTGEAPMTAEDFNQAIVERLRREPFQPFSVEMLDGTQVEIDRPRSVAIGGGTAGGFGRGGKIVSLDSCKVARVFDVLVTPDYTI